MTFIESTRTRLPEDPALTPESAAEIANIEAEIERFVRGELAPERFRAFRLAHGIYGQRQPGVQMIRVKIPSGQLNGRQLRRLADISEEFGTGVSHLTTRQDFQFHYVQLQRVGELLRLLADAGLTTREACGNSVRNVTACPLTGFIAEELFDVQPYSLATYAYLVRNPFCQQLARKFKIAFSSCPEDCASTAIHDIGAVGRVIERDGRTQYGFKLLVGGGLGSTPFTAKPLSEFVPLPELLPTIKGILRVFSEHGNRRNKMKARMKFVINKMGIEEFRRGVERAVASLTSAERAEAELLPYVPTRFLETVAANLAGRPTRSEIDTARALASVRPAIWATKPPLPSQGRLGVFQHFSAKGCFEAEEDAQFLRWQSCSVRPHKDAQRAVVTVMLPLGDIEAPRLRELARLVTFYGEDHARVAIHQNLVLPSVKRSELRSLYDGLVESGLAEAGVGTALDVTACPGADTCGIGITSSKGLTRAIRSELAPAALNGGLESLRGVTIKISGCPNSCGQHHVANIGFHGVAKPVNGKPIPAYQLHLGGRIGPAEARIGEALDKIPARNVPRLVASLIEWYGRERSDGEAFADLVARAPKEALKALIKPFAETLPPEEVARVDWGQTEPFSTDDIGTGECAGAGTDAAIDPFDNFDAEMRQSRLFMERGQWVDAVANLNRSQYTLARVLLEQLGKHPDSDYETTCELRAQVIDRGCASETWNELHAEIAALLATRRPEPVSVRALFDRSVALREECQGTIGILDRRKAQASTEIPG